MQTKDDTCCKNRCSHCRSLLQDHAPLKTFERKSHRFITLKLQRLPLRHTLELMSWRRKPMDHDSLWRKWILLILGWRCCYEPLWLLILSGPFVNLGFLTVQRTSTICHQFPSTGVKAVWLFLRPKTPCVILLHCQFVPFHFHHAINVFGKY